MLAASEIRAFSGRQRKLKIKTVDNLSYNRRSCFCLKFYMFPLGTRSSPWLPSIFNYNRPERMRSVSRSISASLTAALNMQFADREVSNTFMYGDRERNSYDVFRAAECRKPLLRIFTSRQVSRNNRIRSSFPEEESGKPATLDRWRGQFRIEGNNWAWEPRSILSRFSVIGTTTQKREENEDYERYSRSIILHTRKWNASIGCHPQTKRCRIVLPYLANPVDMRRRSSKALQSDPALALHKSIRPLIYSGWRSRKYFSPSMHKSLIGKLARCLLGCTQKCVASCCFFSRLGRWS